MSDAKMTRPDAPMTRNPSKSASLSVNGGQLRKST
jgi:hypothetical protein